MSAPSVSLLDYGMGNLRSMQTALERCGARVQRIERPEEILRAERLVIPGQGAFGQAAERLSNAGAFEAMTSFVATGRPFLGVCLGLQLLFRRSEEAPGVKGLGLIDAEVIRLPQSGGLKIPHMGWAPIEHADDATYFDANASGAAYYFVHSFAAPAAPDCEIAWATHGIRFVAGVAKDNVLATQFHPEKSQETGARLLSRWLS